MLIKHKHVTKYVIASNRGEEVGFQNLVTATQVFVHQTKRHKKYPNPHTTHLFLVQKEALQTNLMTLSTAKTLLTAKL